MRFLPFVLLSAMAFIPVVAHATIKHGLRDRDGRHFIPRGYVVNTNDGRRPAVYDAGDYHRMVRMGANSQVIRLELGRLSSFPGAQLEEAYLQRLVELTRLGREAGLKTIFKMTVYGVGSFSWEAFWANKHGEQDRYLEAWKPVWRLFAGDESVLGYDLVNEPRKLTMDISYDDLTTQHLIPYYERLIDEARRVNAGKLFLCQTIFMNKGEAINQNQYAEITAPIKGGNVVFAPHIYQRETKWIKPTMDRFAVEAELLDAPILIGEWGFPTLKTTDTSVADQLDYQNLYIQTAEVFDRMGVGTVKPWFSGNPSMQNFLPGGPSTWAIFSDEQAVGTVERKYITDVIVRPYPQVIAGDIRSFMFHFATRTLNVSLRSNNRLGASRIFVAADRHYPDGFTVQCGRDLVLVVDPLSSRGLQVVKSGPNSRPEDFVWDPATQQLVVVRWPVDDADIEFSITPGIYFERDTTPVPPQAPAPAEIE